MELFHQNTKIDFMGLRKWTGAFSLIISIISLLLLFTKGLNFGLDFTGGTQLELRYEHPITPNEVREKLEKGGFEGIKVIQYGSTRDILVKIANKKGVTLYLNDGHILEKHIGDEFDIDC